MSHALHVDAIFIIVIGNKTCPVAYNNSDVSFSDHSRKEISGYNMLKFLPPYKFSPVSASNDDILLKCMILCIFLQKIFRT